MRDNYTTAIEILQRGRRVVDDIECVKKLDSMRDRTFLMEKQRLNELELAQLENNLKTFSENETSEDYCDSTENAATPSLNIQHELLQENNYSVAAALEALRATIQADVNQRQRPFHCPIRNIGMNTGDDAINYDDGYETNITRKEKRPNLGKKDNRIHKKRSSLKKTSKRSKADIEKEEKRNKHQKEAVKRSKLKTTKKKF